MDKQKNGAWVKIAVMVLLTILFVVFVGVTLNSSMTVLTYNYNGPIEIVDGKYTGGDIGVNFTIKRKGKYVVHTKWWPEVAPGFITGLQIKDGDRVINWMTGNQVSADFVATEYEPGKYSAEFVILPDEKSYNDFVADHTGGYETSGDVFKGYRDGVFDVGYSLQVEMSRASVTFTFLAGCVVYGLLMGLLIFSMCYKGNSRPEYDERQKLVIGNAYKWAFCTMAALLLIYSLLSYSGMADFMSPAIFCEAAIIVGAAVVASYTLINDGYFAVNAISGRMMGIFAGLFLLTLIGTVRFIMTGMFFKDGRFGTGFILLLITLMTATILTIWLVKRKTDDTEEDE
ncbi:MAG: hypothetical protein J5626_03655 [Lachnospiraceae bacterium]|nr:hypothetical protein [Lachnospiraceae bacterium]